MPKPSAWKELRLAQRQSLVISFVLSLWLLALPAVAEQTDAGASGPSARPEAPKVDPLDDPWLTEQGPPVPRPAEVAREQVVDRWQSAQPTPRARAEALKRVRLELGLGDLTAPAVALLRGASEEDPQIHAQLARDLAPGVPAIQMAGAKAFWQVGETGPATQAVVDALFAIAADFGVQLWLLDNFSILLLSVVLAASLAFMLLAALLVFPHAAHDLGDLLSSRTPGFARTAALVALLMVPLVLGEGVLGLALGLFAVGFTYATRHQRSVLAMAAVLLVIGLHPLAQLVSITTTIVDRDPVAQSATAIARGMATPADVERLEVAAEDDLLAAHALAYRARRLGLEEESLRWLDAIGARFPGDPVVLANRGNIEMRRGNTEAAIDYYERAADLSDSPTLLFDLSQAYASAFRMEEYERTLARAQSLGDREVAALSGLGEAELVADLGFPSGLLLDRFRSLALSQRPDSGIAEMLAPGRLGERWLVTAGAFVLVALFSVLIANRFDRASLCVRCGHRICTRCEDTVWSEEVCEDCHHLFQSPEATDPMLRMARLQALSEREVKIDRIVLVASMLVPGVAGFAARRPDFAMFGLLLFGWALAWILWPSGVFVDPLMMGGAALVCFAIPGVLSAIAYVAVVFGSLVARKNL
jgi:tetratricopeptide (TPR) repeat protein